MDPTMLAFMNAGSNVLGKALQTSAGPSRADSSSFLDGSGWTVNYGGAVAAGSGWPLVALAAGALVLVFLFKRKK